MPRARGFNNGRFTFFTPGAPGMVIGTHVGGIAKIDVSPLFFRHCLEFRIFLFKPLLHKGLVTFPCPVQRLLTSDAELSQKPSHGRGAQNHMELILDQLRHHRARPQRKLEFQLQRVLPRHRAVNPLQCPAIEFRWTSRDRLCFQGAPTTTPVLRQPSVHGGPPHTKNLGNHFGAFAFLYTLHRALTHSL